MQVLLAVTIRCGMKCRRPVHNVLELGADECALLRSYKKHIALNLRERLIRDWHAIPARDIWEAGNQLALP